MVLLKSVLCSDHDQQLVLESDVWQILKQEALSLTQSPSAFIAVAREQLFCADPIFSEAMIESRQAGGT